MSRFKDRLWADLVRAHGADLSKLSRPAPRRGPRPRTLAGTGLGLAAAGTAAAILIGTAGTAPAFAVTQNHDGSVTVWVARPAGIPQANARLAALGYRARIVQVMAGCPNQRWTRIKGVHGDLPPGPPPPGIPGQVVAGTRFDPRQIPAGRVAVIATWSVGRQVAISQPHVVRGQPPACLPPPLPAVACPGRVRQVPVGRPVRKRRVPMACPRGQWQVLPGRPRPVPVRCALGPPRRAKWTGAHQRRQRRHIHSASRPNRHLPPPRWWKVVAVSCPAWSHARGRKRSHPHR